MGLRRYRYRYYIDGSENDPRLVRIVNEVKAMFRAKRIPLRRDLVVYLTPTRQGRAWDSVVLIPIWATMSLSFYKYYVIHELAHIAQRMKHGTKSAMHGKHFYDIFSKVCPKELWKHEIKYFPWFKYYIKRYTKCRIQVTYKLKPMISIYSKQ